MVASVVLSMRWALLLVVLVFTFQAAGEEFRCMSASPCQILCKGSCPSSDQSNQRTAPPNNDPKTLELTQAATNEQLKDDVSMEAVIKFVTAVAEQKALATVQMLTPQQYPIATFPVPDGQWETVSAGHWMSGLFSGVLWQLYELTGRTKQLWADKARLWQAGLANQQRSFASQHDFGFIYLPSFAHSYSVSNSTEDKRQALAAAEALSWAFVPATKSIRTFEGWKTPASTDMYQQIVIIDFMINIQMLVWGAQNVGPTQDLRMDMNPGQTWLNMAMDHARQVAANHVRPDGTTYHIVEYNPNTGSINKRYTYQGHADSSTWARGQAWAMADFAMLYNATRKAEFLEVAQKLSDKYLELLSRQPGKMAAAAAAAAGTEVPDAADYDGFIPQWDFDAPFYPELNGPRDTSAAAVAALGMLYLAEAHPDAACGQRYLCAAVNTLRALASAKYLAAADDADFPALLKWATGGFPLRHHVNVGLISGDYYYLAALQKCSTMGACISA